jgi:prepilin-type N-terminal cleavage/methylation domain-containing protein
MKTHRSAFTLIELLIVVAIIAILAAIAVPNFLEAQTRSKVARVYADFRSIATALEAYQVDNRDYVPSHNNNEFIAGFTPWRRLIPLTTPVAYMTKVPATSPFRGPTEQPDYWTELQYTTNEGLQTYNRPGPNGEQNIYLNGFYRLGAGNAISLTDYPTLFQDGPRWMILDRGPDGVFFYIWANPGWIGATHAPIPLNQTVHLYDPTNGTVSMGEVMRSQMKSSFN